MNKPNHTKETELSVDTNTFIGVHDVDGDEQGNPHHQEAEGQPPAPHTGSETRKLFENYSHTA
jgi:hypothetical protein